MNIVTIEIYFDGACGPKNPGGTASCGWVIYQRTQQQYQRLAHGHKVVKKGAGATNNYAEWCGLGLALRWLLDNMKDQCRDKNLIARGDSKLVVKQLTGGWRCHKPHLRQLRDRCREILNQLDFKKTSIKWIPREQNYEADALSKLV